MANSKKPNIKKDYFWNTLGTSANSFISLLLLIVVTRVNGIEGSGAFSFCFSYAIVFFTAGMYGGRIYQVSDIKGEFSDGTYVRAKLLTSAAMMAAAAVFILSNGYSRERAALLLALAAYKMLDVLADPLYGIMQRNGALWQAGVSMALKATIGFAAFVAVDLRTGSMLHSALCLLAANVVFVAAWDIPRARRDARASDGDARAKGMRAAAALLKKASWIFAFAVLQTLLANIPRYFVDLWHTGDLGYFGIVIMPATLLNLFVTSLIYPKLVPLAEHLAHGDLAAFGGTVRRFVAVALAFGVCATLLAYALACPVLSWVYGVDLSAYRAALTLVTLGGTLGAVTLICTNILSVMRRFPVQLLCYLGGVAALVAACVALTRTLSVDGGVIAFLVANAVQAALFLAAYAAHMRRAKGGAA